MLLKLILFLSFSSALSFNVLICPTLTVTLNRLNGTTIVDHLIADLALSSDTENGNSIYFHEFNQSHADSSQKPMKPPVYQSLWTPSTGEAQWSFNLRNISDGPGSLQFLDADGSKFGPGIDIGFQSGSFYNMDGTFFANISKCYGKNKKVENDDFNYTVCCTSLINLDWMPTIDYFSCGELDSQTTFFTDKGEIASFFDVQYTLTDTLITATVLNYTRGKLGRNSDYLISINHDTSNSEAAPERFQSCFVSGNSTNVNCTLQIKNDLYLDSSYNLVISTQLDREMFGAINGRLIRRNDTWVTPGYTLYSIDNPCWNV
ncbi:hypothetical protein FO519_001856 [Halicephalobus sp. NKZ332]|nr:hypothetical protein FO519_001856 [Halicephalobus sp. NKZ332]